MENITYEAASKELDNILIELKGENISIDRLAEKVERAATLAQLLNEKLRATESKVTEIIKNLGL
jgi:exodeoxyribonuclease VII small subunit